MKNTRKPVLLAAALVACATLSGACAVADPDTSQEVLRYSGGWFNSQAFDTCIGPGVRDVASVGHQHFYYPHGQRTFTFSDVAGADAPPLEVTTKGLIKLKVRGSVTFHLNDNCTPFKETKIVDGKQIVVADWPGGLMQRFHDTIGKHNRAYAESGGDPQPPGWDDVIRIYIGGPISKAANDAGLGYSPQELAGDPTKNAEWQQKVIAALPGLITQQAGGNHFIVDNVQFLQPTLPETLTAEIENNQAAGLRRATADTDKQTADAFGGVGAFLDYLTRRAIADAIKEGKVRVIPVPQGSNVIVNGG